MNFYQRYPGDYMRDTMHLSIAEHGAYSLLLDTYYATEKALPSDWQSLYRICRAMGKAEQAVVRKVADQFFPIASDGLRHNKRADQEIAEAQSRIKSAQENGRKGGRGKNPTGTGDEPTGNPLGSGPDTNPQPSGKAHQNQNHNQSPEPPPEPNLSPVVENDHGAHSEKSSEAEKKLENKATWTAYVFAFKARYGVDPVPNAKANSLIAQLVKRLGGTEAPAVASFYVNSNRALYVSSKHCLDLLVRDCEGIRTEWATGRTVTESQARQLDRKQNNLSVAQQLIAESRNGK